MRPLALPDQLLFVLLIVLLVAVLAAILWRRRADPAPGPSWPLARVFMIIAVVLLVLAGLGVGGALPWGLAFWAASGLV